MRQLLLGGARSGKSRLAEQLASQLEQQSATTQVVYLATCEPADQYQDTEMAQRIARHQSSRPKHWQLLEQPLAIAEAIETANPENCLLIDCLTLWLSNQMAQSTDTQFLDNALATLTQAVKKAHCELILVSNEVGQGIVPADPISRLFRDYSGWMHQQLAQVCDRVIFTTAGLPQVLKGTPL